MYKYLLFIKIKRKLLKKTMQANYFQYFVFNCIKVFEDTRIFYKCYDLNICNMYIFYFLFYIFKVYFERHIS